MEEKILPTSIEHQNNLIINNSTNNNNKENDLSLAGSEITIISGKDDKKNHHHTTMRNDKLEKMSSLSKDNLNHKINHTNNNNHNNNNENTLNKNKLNENGTTQLFKMEQNSSQAQHLIPLDRKNRIPINVLMGVIQLVLSITMVALGCLVLARQATLANSASGLWAGAIAAIAGSLGIINIQRAQTAFLAMSLVCVASSTLAIALTGIGVVRDSNLIHEKSVSAVTAGSGLLFILTIHFFTSVFSVYYSTLKLCTRQFQHEDENDIAIANSSIVSQKKVEEYIKSIAHQQKNGIYNNATIISNEKGGIFTKPMDKRTSWVGIDNLSNLTYTSAPPHMPPYSVMLIPARNNMNKILMPMYPPAFLPPPLPPGMIPQEMQIPTQTPSMNYDMQYYNRSFQRKLIKRQKSQKLNDNQSQDQRQRRLGRRKSEGDILSNREAFQYKGLDRAIAEDYLVQQEKHNHSEKYSQGDVAL